MKRRRMDPRNVTTTIAAIVACAVMGVAVHQIMSRRVRYQEPPTTESQPKSTTPTSRAMTA